MLSGIDYYPKRKKQLKGKLFWFFLLFIILLGMWYYFKDLELPEGNSSSIIISRPVEDNEAESLIANQIDAVNQDDELISEVTIINSESLDEVISNYEANTQN
ncbi:MAG: hypothetical protein HOF63_06300 [Thiotrichales bacterium]|jgi:hypothetical protein|nr:hypothetical protein [Thiotrichales bacterium]MBT3855209.1 hypothetical protein [Thiotrichales bacterium]MBT5499452.1 hypothetical protein [Thiotrichales bacterium]MBT6770864.1 hypothetical protein [Thiotrichales bacterium]MBT7439130.1 hypothetical protein [Thiotrichales bacterium]|tara:strand:+ start:3079 stop:3387 length:309 start_codon:yes stop_codon:yes gene_type:complete